VRRWSRSGSPTGSIFDYAGALTEANHLGNVLGTDGADVGRKIVDEIVRFERSSGQVFARAI
jgi:hypothetical protein